MSEEKSKKELNPGEKRFIKDLKSTIKKSGLGQGVYGKTVLGLKSGNHLTMILSGVRLTPKIIFELAPKAGLIARHYIEIYDPTRETSCIEDKPLGKWPFFKHLIRAINSEDVELILQNLDHCKNTLKKD